MLATLIRREYKIGILLMKPRWIFPISFAMLVMAMLFVMTNFSSYALPEYSPLTAEPCATCHVNPGGGGPRTLRGMLWTVEGRPIEVPILEGILLAPGVTDSIELYDAACAGCHGLQGEGLFAARLAGYDFNPDFLYGIILDGAPRSGMPGFDGQLTKEQLDILVEFVEKLSREEVVPPESYPLPPAVLQCSSTQELRPCGGN